MKNGAPMIAVRMPRGSSLDVSDRDSVSISSRYPPPTSSDAGSSTRWSLPTISRQMCGTTRPTQPTTPETATAPAVISDAPDAYAEQFRALARQLAARISVLKFVAA